MTASATSPATPPTPAAPAGASRLTPGPPRPNRLRRRPLPYLLILPALLLELLVHLGPMLLGIWISFVHLTQLSIQHWTDAPFFGLGNYRNGLNPNSSIGGAVFTSLVRTAAFTVLAVGLSWAIGLFAAFLLNTSFRGRGFFRTFFLVPYAMPAFVTIIGWQFMFTQEKGMVNHLLVDNLHLMDSKPFWLIGDRAFWVIVIVAVWRMWPFAFLMLLAALQTVPDDLYEAASLDGATLWQQFRRITLPSIRGTNAVIVLVTGLWSFNEFNTPYILFGDQPPVSATLLSNLIYNNSFVSFNFGLGAAMSVLLLLILMVVSVFYVRLAMPKESDNA